MMRKLLAIGLVAALLPTCGGSGLVELRLFPCTFGPEGMDLPADVTVVLDSFDEAGAPVETGLMHSFRIDDPMGTFADGHATVGYKKPAAVRTADFRITWRPGTGPGGMIMRTVELTGVAIPDAGGSVDLKPGDMCEGMETTGTDTEATTDPTTVTGTATGTETGTTGTTGTSDPTTTTTGTSDPTTGTTDATTTGTTDATTTGTGTGTDTDTDTEGMNAPPEVGADCAFGGGESFCHTPGPGKVGTLFRCAAGKWEINNSLCDVICGDNPPPMGDGVPISPAQSAGCSGNGWQNDDAWDCLCFDDNVPCDFSGCMPFNAEFDELMFCDQGVRYSALCTASKGGCLTDMNDDTKPICAPNPDPVPP